jgi:hypothetical protein
MCAKRFDSPPETAPLNMEKILEVMLSAQDHADASRISDLMQRDPSLADLLEPLAPVNAIATFGGLLAQPNLQANCLRLEALVHLAVCKANGRRELTQSAVAKLFRKLGSAVGYLEDPAEDVFVSTVSSSRGNFRVFPGIAEGAAFKLQRFLDVTDLMPTQSPFAELCDEVHALLHLSEAVAARVGLLPHSLGAEHPMDDIPSSVLGNLPSIRRAVRFTSDEFAVLGIHERHLKSFALSENERKSLSNDALGHSSLERKPLIFSGATAVLALPTAVTVAIRRYIIECCQKLGATKQLFDTLAVSFERLFFDTPILGDIWRAPMIFEDIERFKLASFMVEIDAGRWLHVVAFIDDFEGFSDGGFSSMNADPQALGACLYQPLLMPTRTA